MPLKLGNIELYVGPRQVGAPDCPGRLEKLLTHPVEGLENHAETIRLPTEARRAIKVFVNVEEI